MVKKSLSYIIYLLKLRKNSFDSKFNHLNSIYKQVVVVLLRRISFLILVSRLNLVFFTLVPINNNCLILNYLDIIIF